MTVQLPETVRSQTADLGGPVHYFDFGGNPEGPLLLCVHGLGGSAWNWAALAPHLSSTCRVVALDLAGHGRTPAVGRGTTVGANRQLLDRFIHEVLGKPVVLVGNSMGGAIAVLQAARSPELVDGLVLIDPALPRPLLTPVDPTVAASFAVMSMPGLGEAIVRRRRRRNAETQVLETLALCCVDSSRVPADVVALAIALAEERSDDEFAARDFLAASRSVVRLLGRPRPFRAAMEAVTAPVLLIHGARDRLVSVQVARRVAAANPTWRFVVGDDLGHVPQLEAPGWTASIVLDWLASRHSESSSSTR